MTIEEVVKSLLFSSSEFACIGFVIGRKQRDQMNVDEGYYILIDPCGNNYETILFRFGTFLIVTKEDFDGIESIYSCKPPEKSDSI